MLQILYTILSTIAIWGFYLIFQGMMYQYQQVLEVRQNEILSQQEQQAEEDTKNYVTMADQVVVEFTDENPVQFGSENYVVTPASEEGMYTMSNVPIEPMATVEALNQAVNEFRRAHGQGPLEIDSKLCEFAAFRAQEIEGEFSHDGFSHYIDEGKADGYGFSHFGENIWTGSLSGVHIVEYGWAKSPGHYSALVGDWTKGCGGVFSYNAVMIFAR